MAYAIQSLVQILEQDQHHLSLDARSAIDSFLEKAHSLIDLVETTPFEIIGDLDSRIRDIAHIAEDLIESYIADQILNPVSEEMEADYELELTGVMEEFESIKDEIIMVKMHSDVPLTQSTHVSSSKVRRLVGFDGDFKRLKNQLLSGQKSELQVIPFVGRGGSGKTYLAEQLYTNSSIVRHVDIRAWTTISQEFNLHDTLIALLDCLTNVTIEMRWRTDEEQLGKYVHNSLLGKRYLIVVDDIWNSNAWDTLKMFFPDEHNGSRIMLTTREWNVAEYATISIYPHQMLPIHDDLSWNLLCENVFGGVGCCPPELVEIGWKIASNCRGHPLSIVTMAGLLSASAKTLDDWKRFESHQLDSTYVREKAESIKEDMMPKFQVDPSLRGFVEFFANDGLKLMSQVMHGQSDLQIMPITGVAEGIGKTILAQLLYDRALSARYFDTCAWVTIKQTNVFVTMQDLLDSLHNSGMPRVHDDGDIGVSLHKTLMNRRYLIVIDGIRDAHTWDTMSRFFPDEGNGSRIILTSGEWSEYDDINPFHLDTYWEFLLGKVVRLVSSSEKTLEFWKLIEEHVSSTKSNGDLNLDLLLMSYNHLPYHLKPCFLYMAAFPEDHEIQVTHIIQLWIAEGFVRSITDHSLEDTAYLYLESLISRNLIFVCGKDFSGKAMIVKIHDVFWKFCQNKALEEKFMWFKDLNGHNIPEEEDIVRRVNVHPFSRPSDEEEEVMSLVRSFLCIGPPRDVAPMLLDLKLLRVFDVLGFEFDEFPEEMLKLVNLRYLAFICNSALPSSISIFRNLQTLAAYKVSSLPSELWGLSQLRHIDCTSNCTSWNISGKGESFQHDTLQHVNNMPASEVTYEFLKHNPNLRYMGIIFNTFMHGLLPLSCLSKLINLHCSFVWSKRRYDFLPYLELPASLIYLSLSSCVVDPEFLATHVGSLPLLEYLSLKKCDLVDLEWEPTEGGFNQLRTLLMEDLNLMHWRAKSNHFPKLQNLEIRDCCAMEEIPSDMGNIRTLEQIIVDEKCSPSVLASAKRVLAEQMNFGNDLLRVFILNGVEYRKVSRPTTNEAESSSCMPAPEMAMQKLETSYHNERQNSDVIMADEAERKGYMAYSTHNFTDAIKHYTDAINLSPHDHLLYSYRSRAHGHLNRFLEALFDAQQVVRLQPDWSEAYIYLGAAYRGLNNYKDEISTYEKALELDPSNEELQSHLFNAKGIAAFSTGNFVDSIRYCTDGMNLRPLNHLLYSIRSLAYAHLDQFFEALSDAQKIVQLKPDFSMGYANLTYAYLGLGEYKDAVSTCEKGLNIDPINNDLHGLLVDAKAKAAFSTGNFADAIQLLTDDIDVDPSNHILYSNRSSARISLEQYFEALSDAQKSVQLKPDWHRGYLRLGDSYSGLHNYKDAVSAYKKGLEIDPTNEDLMSGLSLALSRCTITGVKRPYPD